MTALAPWLFSIMMAFHPPADAVARTTLPAAMETVDERVTRYHEISDALAEVVEDEEEKPIFGGADGRANTAVTLLALSFVESGWRKDVDLGIGPKARGGGADSCLLQIRLYGKGARTAEGYSFEDLVGDRTKCFRAGLHLVRGSYGVCHELPAEQRLAAYAAGTCRSEDGQKKSAARVHLARRMLDRFPPPKTGTFLSGFSP